MASRLPLLLMSMLLGGAAHAAELGEVRVSSFLGQPLVADIELTMLEDAATPVQVRLASANVYRGANIGMPPVLSSLNMSVMRRDGRQFLHVTSRAAVDSAHLHLYLELADGSQRGVRLATLWLSPDPRPAPVVVPAPAPAPVVPAPAVPAPAIPTAPPVLAKAPIPEPARLDKPAPAPVIAPAPVPVRPAPMQVAAPRKAHTAAPKPAPAPAPVPNGAACAPQARPEVNACVALGAKNALLREQLGQLEDKVKVLQVAMGASPAAVVPPLKPYKPKKKKPEPVPETDTPWLLIGGAVAGVLALLGGVMLVRRRKKKPVATPPAAPKPGLGAGLRARLGARVRGGKAVEPTLGEGAHDLSTQL